MCILKESIKKKSLYAISRHRKSVIVLVDVLASSDNVNGIRSKKLELLAYLDFHQPQIVAIQETKIDSSISTSELFPETCQYNVYRKDRNSNGGWCNVAHPQGYLAYAHHRIGK